LKPCFEALPRLGHDFKLHGSTGLLLDDSRAIAERSATHQVTNFELYEIAAAEFALDGAIEQRAVAQAPMFVEIEADRPDVARL
jgi:hypothetical protein